VSTEIESDAATVLRTLAEYNMVPDDPNRGRHSLDGTTLCSLTELTPQRLNDAVEFLHSGGNLELQRYLGTAPFTFGSVSLTPRGRYEHQRMISMTRQEPERVQSNTAPQLMRQPQPVGSPYGFTEEDWEFLEIERRRTDRVKIVLGLQYESEAYNRSQLIENLRTSLQVAVDMYNREPGHTSIVLDFKPLTAGYGEHLFNGIARDIISSDISVFETSDLNPNVMIEMGVAMTWGTRVLPIKAEGRAKPPSDISGQTWADYRNNAAEFVDPEHTQKLVRMIDRAMRKKGSA